MTNKKIRQAFQAALDMEPIMIGGFGHKTFYRLDPGLFFPEQPWHSTVGARLYNQNDEEKARRLLRRRATRSSPCGGSRPGIRVHVQERGGREAAARAVGFIVDLQVVDWATINSRAPKPELWDVASTGLVFTADPPTTSVPLQLVGLVVPRGEGAAARRARTESDVKKRKALVERIQVIFYEDVGRVKLGDYFTLDVARRDLRGDFRTAPRLYFWNSWLAK